LGTIFRENWKEVMKNNSTGCVAAVVSSLALLLALGACGNQADEMSPAESGQASVEINRQGMEGAKDEKAAIGVENNTVRMGTGDTSVMDPDVLVAEQVKAALASSPDVGAVKVDVHSRDGDVTLRGQVPDPAARDRATEIARSVRDVKSVDNQLTLG
jgi:hyperosmotically inducible periplasmic protein